MITVIASQKGGVAKTTTTVTLAHLLANQGYNTLIVDQDMQANTLFALGLQSDDGVLPDADIYETGRANLQILPACGREVSLLELKSNYDAIVVDMPPNSFAEMTTLPYADIVIIPASLEVFGLNGVRLTMASVRRAAPNAQIWILPTIYNRSALHRDSLAKLNELYDGDVAPHIFSSGFVPRAQTQGQTIYEYNHRGLDDVRYGYNKIGEWLMQSLEGGA